jgi:Fur family ferric uptake transcriptional regulator
MPTANATGNRPLASATGPTGRLPHLEVSGRKAHLGRRSGGAAPSQRLCPGGTSGVVSPSRPSQSRRGGPRRFLVIAGELFHDVVMPLQSPVEPADLLREQGVQVTAQRRAGVRVVSGQPRGTADSITEIGAISRRAACAALRIPADRGLIRRVQPAGSPARFEVRVGDNHHHVTCRVSGRMVDVDCAIGETPCPTTADDSGSRIDEAEVAYRDRCPDRPASSPTSAEGQSGDPPS